MITKIKLYFDTIKRIPLKQNFFLIKEKVLKKVFPLSISTYNKIESKQYSEDIWSNFLKKSIIIKNSENLEAFWDYGVSDNDYEHYYHYFMQNILEKYRNSNDIKYIDELWKTSHEDIEFIYNIQRLYKFPEIMNKLKFDDRQKLSVIKSWIENSPPQKGPSWMGFNCSIRLINWVKILSSFENTGLIEEIDVKKIFISIFQNLEFITKNIEHHIPGNHVIFQYFSVWLITILIDDERANQYSKLFEVEFENEFLESGLHFELSTHYHLQVLQLGVYFALINYNKNKIPASLLEKISKAYLILDAFSFSENTLPLIGDNCYNFFHNNLVEDAENLNSLRKYFNFNELNDRKIHEIKDQYIIVKKDRTKLIFDVGNIGMKQNPGHGHSDNLSINYSYNGIPIFIDPGTKRYSNLPDNLELKRACQHNTVSINDEDQSKLWGFFRWAFLPEKTIYNYRSDEKSVVLEASFKGFRNIGGAKHSRIIEIKDVDINVFDLLESDKLKTIEQNFILSEFVKFEQIDGKYYLKINNYRFEFIVDSKEPYKLEIIPLKIYKSYDNPTDSNKIRITYNASANKLETNIKLKLINE